MSLLPFFYNSTNDILSLKYLYRVTKYAEEDVAYGINYFVKVSIGNGLFIHIRVHRQEHHEKYDFYSLHETIKHNVATCVFTEGIYL